jgi:hypothetical protein
LFGDCMYIHRFDYSLISTFINKTQVLSPITCTILLRNSLPSLWNHSKKWKTKTILCVLCTLVRIFGTHVVQNWW